jgi:cytochrome c oxidase assembly protein subunit 11
MTMTASANRLSNGSLAAVFALIALVFLALSFALVPLYRTLCEVTGLNGTTTRAVAAPRQVVAGQWVSVEFTSTVMPGLPWRFEPEQEQVRLHPGEVRTVFYRATNLADSPTIGQAVMSVTPEIAATHFKKITCFCFKNQTLAAHESRRMAVMFYVAPDISRDVNTITLSYAVFGITKAKG